MWDLSMVVGDVGLMGILARAVMDNGGHVTGIIPEICIKKYLILT
jgi:predicted Rossmann-fold nucleotide-binding protein